MPTLLDLAGRSRRRTAALAIAAVTLAAALYGTLRLGSNADPTGCGNAEPILTRLRPLATGEVAAFEVGKKAVLAPDLSFTGPDGRARRLADYRDKTVLLNLWATWCEPCKREMPALDRLQAELGGPGFDVLAVNIDTRNVERPRAWLTSAGITRLDYLSDPSAKVFQDLRNAGDAEGMPTTILVGRGGCRLGRMSGPAEWASPDGLRLIRAALDEGQPRSVP